MPKKKNTAEPRPKQSATETVWGDAVWVVDEFCDHIREKTRAQSEEISRFSHKFVYKYRFATRELAGAFIIERAANYVASLSESIKAAKRRLRNVQKKYGASK